MTVLELKNYIKNNNIGDDYDVMVEGFSPMFSHEFLELENLDFDTVNKTLELSKVDKFKMVMQ